MHDLTMRNEGLEILDEDESLRLMGTVPIGRVAVVMGALPAVLPVNFVVRDRTILFRTSPGTKLTAALHNSVVAFEVDAFDPVYHDGWSVMAVGRSCVWENEIPDMPLSPWVDGERAFCVAVDIEILTGRRITHVAEALPRL